MTGWTVDYGSGPRPVSLPHAWRQDVPVAWEGPTVATAMLAAIARPRECPLRLAFSPRPARYVRLRSLAEHKNLWRVAEIQVHAR